MWQFVFRYYCTLFDVLGYGGRSERQWQQQHDETETKQEKGKLHCINVSVNTPARAVWKQASISMHSSHSLSRMYASKTYIWLLQAGRRCCYYCCCGCCCCCCRCSCKFIIHFDFRVQSTAEFGCALHANELWQLTQFIYTHIYVLILPNASGICMCMPVSVLLVVFIKYLAHVLAVFAIILLFSFFNAILFVCRCHWLLEFQLRLCPNS